MQVNKGYHHLKIYRVIISYFKLKPFCSTLADICIDLQAILFVKYETYYLFR